LGGRGGRRRKIYVYQEGKIEVRTIVEFSLLVKKDLGGKIFDLCMVSLQKIALWLVSTTKEIIELIY
jgi:hypothetical protein